MKSNAWLGLLQKFHGKRLLLDANLLLAYLKGAFYRVHTAVPQPDSFKEEEFELLAQIIQHFQRVGRVLTTPHLLTEMSNVSKNLKENRFAFLVFIRSLVQELDEKFDAKRIGARRLVGRDGFPRFGLADAVIINLAYDPILILTNDKPMARYLQEEKRRKNVFYFGDIKELCLSHA